MIGRLARKPALTMRFGSQLPAGDYFGGSNWQPDIALSPDGSHIAYVATHEGVTQLYLGRVGEDGRALPGTGDAHTPFFSPDGKWLGAVTGRKLLKFPVAGGAPVAVASLPSEVYGACWNTNGWIYMGSEAPLALLKVQAQGGMVFGATTLQNKTKREIAHRFPALLPGGKWLLFTNRNAAQRNFDQADIAAVELETGKVRMIAKGGTNPHYLPTGHLVFVRAGALMAVPFDPEKLEAKGTPVAVVQGVMENPYTGASQFSVSADGSLVYLASGVTYGEREMVFVEPNGTTRVLTATKRPYEDLMLSPDGKLIATTIDGPETDSWIHDIARDTDTRFTSEKEFRNPSWSADGKRVFYGGFDEDGYSIFGRALDGSGKPEELVDADEMRAAPGFASRDGSMVLWTAWSFAGPRDIMTVRLEKRPKPGMLIARPPDEDWAQISPDGHWIAYNTDESGRAEVIVATYPDIGSKVKVSTDGGRHPQWSPDGKKLYFLQDGTADSPRPFSQRVTLMAVPVETSPTFKFGTASMLFQGPFFESIHDYAVTPDGKGFIFIRESPPTERTAMKVILNWDEELKRRVPAN
jgi:serine/threonine-protein kinase